MSDNLLVRGGSRSPLNADNGKIISDWVLSRPEEPLRSKSGRYWMRTTADFGIRSGVEVDFQGSLKWSRISGTWHTATSAVVLIYDGPADQPAFRIASDTASFQGLNLWRSFWDEGLFNQAGSVGAELLHPCTSPSFSKGSWAGWDTAIRIKKSNHVECIDLEDQHFFSCNTCISNEEQQAFSHTFENIVIHSNCHTFMRCVQPKNSKGVGSGAGGGLATTIDGLSFTMPCLGFDIEYGNVNAPNLDIRGWYFDNSATGSRLFRHRAGSFAATVRGNIQNECQLAKDAIVLGPGGKADVQLEWRNRVWPEAYKWSDTANEWVVR